MSRDFMILLLFIVGLIISLWQLYLLSITVYLAYKISSIWYFGCTYLYHIWQQQLINGWNDCRSNQFGSLCDPFLYRPIIEENMQALNTFQSADQYSRSSLLLYSPHSPKTIGIISNASINISTIKPIRRIKGMLSTNTLWQVPLCLTLVHIGQVLPQNHNHFSVVETIGNRVKWHWRVVIKTQEWQETNGKNITTNPHEYVLW